MDYKDADEVLAVCAKATPGPWEMFQDKQTQDGCAFFEIISALPYWIAKVQCIEGYAGKINGEANADFIAISREALPYWVERAKQLEAALKAISNVKHTTEAKEYGEVILIPTLDSVKRFAAEALAALEGQVNNVPLTTKEVGAKILPEPQKAGDPVDQA